MQKNSVGRILIIFVSLLVLSRAAIISNVSANSATKASSSQDAVFFTIVTNVPDLTNSNNILSQLAVPGFSRKHGFNYIALDGWSCSHDHGPVISIWESPNNFINASLASNSTQTRKILKQFYKAAGVKLLVNAFSTYQNPASENVDAFNCSSKLQAFIQEYDLDGANIDFQDLESLKSNAGINWLTQFSLGLNQNSSNMIFSHTIQADIFDSVKYLHGDYSIIEKVVGQNIKFYNIKYYNSNSSLSSYKDIFTEGLFSVSNLAQRGIPANKIVIGKPSMYNATGFVRPNRLIHFYRRANAQLNWWGGAMFTPYISRESEDQTRLVTLRRDNIEAISAVNLDSVNFWWPPEKTVADIGVPGYAPSNMYNNFIFGTWTCKSGAFDISKLWSNASVYLSTTFGNTTSNIQLFLKEKYELKSKHILVRAFGAAESPTSAQLDPTTCANELSSFIKSNNLDGVDVNYQDNIAFNNGIAQNWLIAFTNSLRKLLPFHIISHSIQNYHLDRTQYRGGSYARVISTVGNLLDFYNIQYYGRQHTNFDTYQELFVDSGTEFTNISVTQLVAQGFDIEKIVIAKPVRLYDAQGAGFLEPSALREIFLQANANLGWRGGICYSSYLNDQNGEKLLMLLRGINKTDSKRFAYVDNVNAWWPPKSTLAQMGVPTLAAENIYNYFAYAFWTCKSGAQAMSKVYNDPITYLGTDLGKTKSDIQTYIKDLYSNGSVKLLVSAFGASQFPVKENLDPVQCGSSLVSFMNDNKIDGVDIDFEDSEAFINGTGQQWVNVFMRQIRRSKPFHIVSHAPQAPYFSSSFSASGSYLNIHNNTGKFIDFYNIQFYNQGVNTPYSTYQELFVDSGIHNPNTSLFQIINQGVEAEKVVLGKPVTQNDAYNTGFVASSSLKALLKQAVNDSNNPGWTPSVMYWQYLSDLSGASIAETMSYGK